jgi:hypothetical protein
MFVLPPVPGTWLNVPLVLHALDQVGYVTVLVKPDLVWKWG